MTDQNQSNFSTVFRNIIRWKNTSGESVPPYGIVQVDSYDEAGVFYLIIKPDDDGKLFFINGNVAVPDQSFGTSLPWDGNAIPAQFEASDHEFAENAGVVADQWYLGEGNRFQLVSSIVSVGSMNVGSVLDVSGGGGGATILFEITAVDVDCKKYLDVKVLGGPCGGEPVPDDTLQVWDEAGCFIDLPDDELESMVGVNGFAVKMKFASSDEDISPCPDRPDCRWVILQLCCSDPI